MNTDTMTPSPGLTSLHQQAATWWQARTARERQAVVVVALVLGLFVVWSLFMPGFFNSWRKANLRSFMGKVRNKARAPTGGRTFRQTPQTRERSLRGEVAGHSDPLMPT